MFTRPYAFNQAGRVSSPFTPRRSGHPAGLGFSNRMKPCFNLFQGPQFQHTPSPQPSPFTSPVRGGASPLADDDAPPKKSIFDEFPMFASPKRVVNPGHPHNWFQPKKPSPPAAHAHAPAPATANPPLSVKPSPRKRFGYKRLSINREAARSCLRNCHGQERIRQKKIARHERLAARARADLQRMRDEVENTMHSTLITNEDKIFAQQLRRLHLDSVFRNNLSRYRDTAERAEDETPQRLEAHAEMESDAERLREQAKKDAERQEELRIIRKMREEKEKKRQEEERVRVEEARRRAREDREKLEEQQRKAREAREREAREREARGREAREREAREREAREREARQREAREREAREHEARERGAREREAKERQARERKARERAEAAHRAEENPRALQQLFALYEAKWAELKTNHTLSSIDVRELPWPSLVLKHFTAQEITREDVLTFIFHPLRPCPMQKSAKDRVRVEVLRFHPDKFNVLVLPKVREDHRAVAQELAGAAVRALTTIMAESD